MLRHVGSSSLSISPKSSVRYRSGSASAAYKRRHGFPFTGQPEGSWTDRRSRPPQPGYSSSRDDRVGGESRTYRQQEYFPRRQNPSAGDRAQHYPPPVPELWRSLEHDRHRQRQFHPPDDRQLALRDVGFSRPSSYSRRPKQDTFHHPQRSKEVAAAPVIHPVIQPEDAVPYFESNVRKWTFRNDTVKRIVSYGIPEVEARILLKNFVREVQAGTLSSEVEFYGLDRFGQPHEDNSIETIYSTIFFSWAARLKDVPGVTPAILAHIQRLVEATSQKYPGDAYPRARRIKRKVIMHVGPTNSGKTHHALRALAASNKGLYAGPLRLLAHEIYQRFSQGTIVPLGIEQDPAAPVKPNPAYARLCNMVTGEERILHPGARLVSCTTEMLDLDCPYDVAVIDEIQLIGDPQRGQSWTTGVLGLQADELHLCGEETAVPVIKKLLAQTGDEIEVRHYERLTPLAVDPNALEGDLSKVQKGDCVVAFSRTDIFALKKKIESASGKLCAVVYGRLPPEIRNKQAALFNDPESGYDVLIGSDAIGMGLNLKIKRMIFSTASKFNGREHVPLDVSSVKQIAGRAGRFGLHKDDRGGTVTTMFQEDIPYLEHCLAQPYRPLPYARIGFSGAAAIPQLLALLPPSDDVISQALAANQYIGRIPSHLRYTGVEQLKTANNFITQHWSDMPIKDKVSLLYCPIPWKVDSTVECITPLLLQHSERGFVKFYDNPKISDLLKNLEHIEDTIGEDSNVADQDTDQGNRLDHAATSEIMDADEGRPTPPIVSAPPRRNADAAKRHRIAALGLLKLETLHKILVVYVWWSLRHPLIYTDGEKVGELKTRTETAMSVLLKTLSAELSEKMALKDMLQRKTLGLDAEDPDLKLAQTLERLGY